MNTPQVLVRSRRWLGERPIGKLLILITVPAFVAALFIGNWHPWGPWIVAAMMTVWVLAAIASGLEEQKVFGNPPRPLTWRQRFRVQPVWATIDALIIVAALSSMIAWGASYLLGVDLEGWFDRHRLWFWIGLGVVQFAQVLRPKQPQRDTT